MTTIQEQLDSGFLKIDKYDWPEDFSLENGQYECECMDCTVHFFGHKRRQLCKVCASKAKS